MLDVGCNSGQFVRELRPFYRQKIVSFEPVSQVYNELIKSKLYQVDNNWTTYQVGLSDKNEEAVINVSAAEGVASSVLKPTSAKIQILHEEKIQLRRLDEYQYEAKNIFLKIDVQGLELKVINGIGNLIPQIKVIMLEVSNVPSYADAPSLNDVLDTMESLGFQLTFLKHNIRSNAIDYEYDLVFVTEDVYASLVL